MVARALSMAIPWCSLLIASQLVMPAWSAVVASNKTEANRSHHPAWNSLTSARIPIFGAEEFLPYVDTAPAVLAVFLAPWCAHSKRLAADMASPQYAELFAAPENPEDEGGSTSASTNSTDKAEAEDRSSTLGPGSDNSTLATQEDLADKVGFATVVVDCVASPDLYNLFDIEIFPTVVLLRWGVEAGRMRVNEASEFTAANLHSYVTEKAGLPTRRSDSGEGRIEVIANDDAFFDLILDSGIQAQGTHDPTYIDHGRLSALAFAQPIVIAWYPETQGDEYRMDHFSLYPSSEFIAASLSHNTQYARFVRLVDFGLMQELLEMAEEQEERRYKFAMMHARELTDEPSGKKGIPGEERDKQVDAKVPRPPAVKLTEVRKSVNDTIVMIMARPLSWDGLQVDLSRPHDLQVSLRIVPETISTDMPRRDLADWISERSWPSIIDHTEGNKPYFKNHKRPGYQRHLLAFSGLSGNSDRWNRQMEIESDGITETITVREEPKEVQVLRRAMAMVTEHYMGRLCSIMADDARSRGVMSGLRLPPLQSGANQPEHHADIGLDKDAEQLGSFATPGRKPNEILPKLRLVVSKSTPASSSKRSSLLKFAFDDEDSKLKDALESVAEHQHKGKDEDEAFESAAMTSCDVILEWLDKVSDGSVPSF